MSEVNLFIRYFLFSFLLVGLFGHIYILLIYILYCMLLFFVKHEVYVRILEPRVIVMFMKQLYIYKIICILYIFIY